MTQSLPELHGRSFRKIVESNYVNAVFGGKFFDPVFRRRLAIFSGFRRLLGRSINNRNIDYGAFNFNRPSFVFAIAYDDKLNLGPLRSALLALLQTPGPLQLGKRNASLGPIAEADDGAVRIEADDDASGGKAWNTSLADDSPPFPGLSK